MYRRRVDTERARIYVELVLRSVRAAVRKELESLMLTTWKPRSEFLRRLDRQARIEGREEGRVDAARGLLADLLRQRFGDLPAGAASRIGSATAEEAGRWARACLDAPTLEAVFVDPPPER